MDQQQDQAGLGRPLGGGRPDGRNSDPTSRTPQRHRQRSDKRSPGKDPRLQYAFKNQVLGVSCISHRLTQLAAFFIDQRTE